TRQVSDTPARDKGKQRQTSPEHNVQEYEEREAREKQEAEERVAAEEADITPFERRHVKVTNLKTARRMQRLAEEWTEEIWEVQKNVARQLIWSELPVKPGIDSRGLIHYLWASITRLWASITSYLWGAYIGQDIPAGGQVISGPAEECNRL
ncbi:hypothetical protein B0H14DRAFT_2659414, partial [Mycena olivaceomarginata]